MAKHPVPKKKAPKSQTSGRFHTYVTNVQKKLKDRIHLVPCPNCKQKHLVHHVCPNCGKYRGRQVLNMGKEIDKITKIKA
ncbi:50S ribosomal protein L32 [Candidatus Peregrinibacteria bacterium]|nr:50S ribosomal protein L32 [Candidatus Peregrinibacteria bacterium]